jgi:hypothetical protein
VSTRAADARAPASPYGAVEGTLRVEKENLHVFVCNVQISRADRLRLRLDGGAGHRRTLARRPDDSGDGLQLGHWAGGNYLADSNVAKPRADAEDAALATRLWAESAKIVEAL